MTSTLLLGTVLALGGAEADAGHNLLDNGRYERGMDGWSTGTGAAVYVADTSEAHWGRRSCRGEESEEFSGGWLYQDISADLVPGLSYVVSGWVKADTVAGDLALGLTWVDAMGTPLPDGFVGQHVIAGGDSGWIYHQSPAFLLPPPPPGATALRFYVDFYYTTGIAWFDDLAVEAAGPEITVWNPSFESYALPFGGWTADGTGLDPWTVDGTGDVGVWHSGWACHDLQQAYSRGPTIGQAVSATVQPGHTYLLNVAVGATPGLPVPGYAVGLVGESSPLASDTNSMIPPDGGFVASRVVYESPDGDPAAGENLSIHLDSVGPDTSFDQVSLVVLQESNHNLVDNPGFEDGLTAWSTSMGSAVYTVDATDPLRGAGSLKAVETETGSLGRCYQDLTDRLQPGGTYRLTGWIKTEDVVGLGVSVDLAYVDGIGATGPGGLVARISVPAGSSGWSYYDGGHFSLPDMPETAEALWLLTDLNGASGTAWFDGLRLEAVVYPGGASGPLFSSGDPIGGCCREVSGYTVADDLAVTSGARVRGVEFRILDFSGTFPDEWDGHLQWWFYTDNAGSPGTVIDAGFAPSVNLYDGGSNHYVIVSFDREVVLEPGPTYWFAMHLGETWATRDWLWNLTDTGWGSTARGDNGGGVGPWFDLGQHPAFQLLGDRTLPFADGFESGTTTAWSSDGP